jgi:hypothetical protein
MLWRKRGEGGESNGEVIGVGCRILHCACKPVKCSFLKRIAGMNRGFLEEMVVVRVWFE